MFPPSKRIIEGENVNFTCELLGGSNNNSINVEWSITYRNDTTDNILRNNSNFLLLSSNSVLVIVRASAFEFDGVTIMCDGGRNFSGLSASLIVNRKCVDECVDESRHIVIQILQYLDYKMLQDKLKALFALIHFIILFPKLP